jgi:hypothetical protein
VRCVVGRESFVATAGAYVVKPRGVDHECVNDSRAPASLIEITVPGRIEGFYRELDALTVAAVDQPAEHHAAVQALSLRYAIGWITQ